jgi:CMP-N,N'-diacetyllegionaminic acid synthase
MDNRITAIVPARGGSKRLPNKNIKEFLGRPLIFHTIDAFLLKGSEVDRVLFTTDSEVYVDLVQKEYGEEVQTVLRPPEFAGDKTKVVDEIERLLLDPQLGIDSSWFMVGLPTAPLRDQEMVKALLTAWRQDHQPCFSASTYEFAPQFCFAIDEEGHWVPQFESSPMVTGQTRSQDIPTLYRPNGAIYLTTKSIFLEKKSFYNKAKPFVTDPNRSIDVDTKTDFVIAEIIAKELEAQSE